MNELPNIDDGIGAPEWRLTLCLAASWLVLFLTLVKGVQSSGKVAYFTGTTEDDPAGPKDYRCSTSFTNDGGMPREIRPCPPTGTSNTKMEAAVAGTNQLGEKTTFSTRGPQWTNRTMAHVASYYWKPD